MGATSSTSTVSDAPKNENHDRIVVTSLATPDAAVTTLSHSSICTTPTSTHISSATPHQTFSASQLAEYTGDEPVQHNGRLLMGVCGLVYDVTKGVNFYGPGGGYHNLCGVGMSKGGDTADLDQFQLDSLKDWVSRLSDKYAVVGKLAEISPEEKAAMVASKAADALPLDSARSTEFPLPVDQSLTPFTVEQLGEYTGDDPSMHDGKIFMGVCGLVYDVTKGLNFYGPGGGYHNLAGVDATRILATMDMTQSGGFTDDLDEFQMESLEDWVNRLSEKYAVVGRLTSLDIAVSGDQTQRTFTTAQLAEYSGDEAFHHNGQIFIAVRSKVYDVTLGASFYGPGAAYHALAGKDATRILATMDMQEKGGSTVDLNPEQIKSINDWEIRLEAKYEIIGRLLE